MKITKIREVKTPTRGTECSAGLDLYVPKGFTARLTSGTDILVPSGIKVEVPHGYALIAMNRSSVATSTDAMRRAGLTPKANTPKGTLVVGACVVDEDNNLRPYRLDKAKSGVAELQTEFAESVGSTLTSARPNNVYGDTFPYRIRRLIPRECFRLMDVDDEDYDKIKNYVKGHRKNGKPMYISESQQYKLAGNSIVVACMEHIFEQLFFPSGRVTEPRQLDIFDII